MIQSWSIEEAKMPEAAQPAARDDDEDLKLEDDIDVVTPPEPVRKASPEPAPQVVKPAPVPGPAAKPAAPEVGLQDLERQLADERALKTRVAAENQRLARERDQAIVYAQEADKRGVSTYEMFTENQIVSIRDQMDALQAQQETAYSDGDFKTVAEINRKFGKLNTDLAILERDKAALAEQRQRQPQTTQRQPAPATPAPVPTDPVERAIQNRTEPTKQFLRKHTELIRSDGTLKRAAIDAHESALDAGYSVDTPGYFDHIEKVIAGGGAENGGAPVRGQRAPQIAAPVERGGNSAAQAGGVAPGEFRATATMRRLAREQGVPLAEWVENYQRLLREGRITPINY
jgi:hypothetical protein